MIFGKKKDTQAAPIKPNFISTQQFLEIDEIRDDVLILKDKSMRSILMVSSINMELKTDEEQNIVLSAFQGALNSLGFPLQMLVQSRRVDLTNYLNMLRESEEKQKNMLLREQTSTYIAFLEDILSSVNVMDKRFFVVVPHYPNIVATQSKGILASLFGGESKTPDTVAAEKYALNYKELKEKTQLVMSLMGSSGLASTQLPTEAIVELFYICYNPETAGHQHIKNLDSISSDYISMREALEEGDEEVETTKQ